MATIARKLFGRHPSFLKQKKGRNVFELAAYTPDPKGLVITNTAWYKQGLANCYYKITDININPDLKSGTAKGILTWLGHSRDVEVDIENADSRTWHLYYSPQETDDLLMKLKS
jgi:hypothetical protein